MVIVNFFYIIRMQWNSCLNNITSHYGRHDSEVCLQQIELPTPVVP